MRCSEGVTNGYQQCSFTDSSGRTMELLFHRPTSYDPHRKYPLVLVLHGGGERARAGATTSQACGILEKAPYVKIWVSNSLNKDVPGVQSRWPSFVVVPLLSGQNRWVDASPRKGSYHLAASPTPQLAAAKEMVDWLQKEYSGIDINRLYITGVSLGGYGTWDAIERWPHYFAAAVPVSGAGDPSRAATIKNLPIWAFHGAADRIVPVSGSRDMVDAIRAAGGHPFYTEYDGARHDIWSRAYSLNTPSQGESIFQWLFAQHKAVGPLKTTANGHSVQPGTR